MCIYGRDFLEVAVKYTYYYRNIDVFLLIIVSFRIYKTQIKDKLNEWFDDITVKKRYGRLREEGNGKDNKVYYNIII